MYAFLFFVCQFYAFVQNILRHSFALSYTYIQNIGADLIDPFVLDAVSNLPSSYTLSILRIMRSVPPQWHFNCLTAGWSLLSKYMWTSTVLTAEPILSGLSLSVNYFISNSGPPILCFRAKYVASFLRPDTRTCKLRRRSDRSLRLGFVRRFGSFRI